MPPKISLVGHNNLNSTIWEPKIKVSSPPDKSFDKLVFVVIDALRMDHVEQIPLIQSLMYEGKARVFEAEANLPTVTLPRIKALTTGDVSVFLDVIVNLASPELNYDNIIYQMNSVNHNITFYGDDTWIRLFPDSFIRKEGTTSFFVNDYTEVDQNVTRNVKIEIDNNDWTVMILHYLGLDHIGHLIGPRSHLVPPKLEEMSKVLEMIWKKIDERTLIVVCGDHGMNDAGSHGGASQSEIKTPFIMLSKLFHGKRANFLETNQIDAVPTLSCLFGLAIPKNNLGIIIAEAVEDILTPKDVLKCFHSNAQQISIFATDETSFLLKAAYNSHETFLSSNSMNHYKKALQSYQIAIRKISDDRKSNFIEFDTIGLYFGLMITTVSCIYLTIVKEIIIPKSWLFWVFFLFLTMGLLIFSTRRTTLPLFSSSYVSLNLFGLLAVYSMLYGILHSSFIAINLPKYYIVLIIHGISLLSTSYIEEEHQFFHFFTLTLSILMCRDSIVKFNKNKIQALITTAALCTLCRLQRIWNSSGDKWAHLYDVGDFLDDNKIFLALAFILSIIVISICLFSKDSGYLWFLLGLSFAGFSKYYIVEVFYARGAIIICLLLGVYYRNWRRSLCIFSLLLLRPRHVPALGVMYLQEILLFKLSSGFKSSDVALAYYLFGKSAFFSLGNSNKLSTVDLASAFVGLSENIEVIAGFNMFICTFCGQINWFVALVTRLRTNLDVNLNIKLFSVEFCVFLVGTVMNRYHLFVWTVFAPKFLYVGMEFILISLYSIVLVIINKYLNA